jgi:colanic acid biosynthesis glycosyl transferase WcaI
LYRSTSGIIVLGRDMAHRVTVKDPTLADRITVVPNWAELEQIEDRPYAPRAHGLRVQYAGNIGRTHDFATLLEAAPRLAADGSDVHFEILGDGTRRKWLEREVAARRLSNVTIAPPGADRGFRHLAQADVALITLAAGMPGVSVPSRMYNALAAARPIIAVAEADSELARVVREEQVGWVVAPGDVAGFAATISEASRSPELLQNMSRRARAAALRNYSFERSLMGYNRAVAALLHTEQVNAYEPS